MTTPLMDSEGRGVDSLAAGHVHRQGQGGEMGPWEGRLSDSRRRPAAARARYQQSAAHRCRVAFAAAEGVLRSLLLERRP